MLKKLLTTFIVLASTATAWAEGYGYTLDKDGARATITTGEQTLEEVIADIKGLTPTVQYIILPDGMKKAEVNSIATANGFVVAVSKNEATKTEAKWVYTYNGEEFIYEGTPTTTDGVSTANVKVLVDLTETKFSYTLWGQPYNGTVFFDAQGNCYGVQNADDVFDLTKKQGYTYNNGTTEYTGKVAEADGKYYGVINNPTEVALDLSHPVSWTYDNGKYAHLGEVYNNGTNIFWQGGTEYPLTTETRYTYDNGSKLYPENGLTRTADNKTYGWVGGTQVNLTQKDAWFEGTTLYTGVIRKEGDKTFGGKFYEGPYELTTANHYTYKDNNNTQLYTGATRTADGKTYGNTGNPFNVSFVKDAYIYDNGTKVYTGATRTADGKTYGNTGSGEVTLTSKQAYTYNDNGIKVYTGATRTEANGKIYGNTGEMLPLTTTTTAPWTYKDATWPNPTCIYESEYISGTNGNVGGTFYELQTITATAETPVYTYYSSGIQYYYDGEVTGEGNEWYMQYYGTVDGSKIPLTPSTSGEYKYYIKDGKKIIYTGNVYTKLDGTGQYACEGGTSVAITKAAENVKYYTDADNKKVVYTGNVYTDNDNKEYGVKDINYDKELTYGTVYYNGEVLFTGNVYVKGGNNVGYTTNPNEITLEQKDVYVKNDKVTVYSGNVYIKDEQYIGFEHGYEVELTYGEVYLKASDKTLYTGNVYYTQGNNTELFGGKANEFEISSAKAYFYTPDGGEETQYTAGIYNDGENTVGFVGGEEKVLTHGEVKSYTKDGQILIATDNSRISLDGDTYCEGVNAYNLMQKEESYTANLYKDGEGRSVIYTGKVYGDATGYIGGTETELAYGDVYKKKDDTIYTGYRNEDNTKGCNNPQKLTTSFTYAYTDPNNGETVEFTDAHHLTTKEVDYTAIVEQKEMEIATGKIHLIAYVSTPGSLYYAIGDKYYGAADLTAITLSGSLNYADIGNGGSPLAMNKYGHAIYDTYSYDPETNQTTKSTITPSDDIQEGAIESKNCAFTNVTNLQYIDFSDAKFNVNTDMQISGGMTYNIEAIKTVFLPTDPTFTTIPAGCFLNAKGVTEICIPKNIKIIEGKAFHNTALSHIYTTSDDEDVIVDNGTNTITLPAGLEEIRSAGNGSEATFSGAGMDKITDVHVLSEIAPKCSPYSFQGSMTFGNKGFEGNWAHPIGRHIYVNGKQMITVLHFPSSCTTEETKKYTDITRNYTLADETGAVDGKGKTIIWPRHAQFWRAFNQAIMGYIWSDWDEYKGDDKEVIMEWSQEILKEQTTKYDRAYQGWHEFVLTGTSISHTIQVQEETEFIQRDWYTLCVPYNLKKSHLLELFGIDKDKSAYNTVKMLKETESKGVTETMYPDIRVITEISRSVSNGRMAIHLSKPLLNDNGNNWEVVIGEKGKGFDYKKLEGEDPVIIKGGHPFLIRGYVPAAWNDKIKNLGMYIMAIAASDNSNAVLEGKEEPYKYNDECLVNNVALPCVKHHIHARNFDYDENDEKNKNQFVFKDAAHTDAACYHFIGTYTETKIPQYAYYIGKAGDGSHKFSRTTKTTFKWAPYSAVIVGLNNPKYNDKDFEGGKTSIHNIIVGLDTPTNDLIILEGEDSARAGQALSIKFDENAFSGEATGITDININSNVNISNNKVYSINGQYMGTSLNNLPKGIYIINGQKKVVK